MKYKINSFKDILKRISETEPTSTAEKIISLIQVEEEGK